MCKTGFLNYWFAISGLDTGSAFPRVNRAIWYNFYFDLVPQFPLQKEKFYKISFGNPPNIKKKVAKKRGKWERR